MARNSIAVLGFASPNAAGVMGFAAGGIPSTPLVPSIPRTAVMSRRYHSVYGIMHRAIPSALRAQYGVLARVPLPSATRSAFNVAARPIAITRAVYRVLGRAITSTPARSQYAVRTEVGQPNPVRTRYSVAIRTVLSGMVRSTYRVVGSPIAVYRTAFILRKDVAPPPLRVSYGVRRAVLASGPTRAVFRVGKLVVGAVARARYAVRGAPIAVAKTAYAVRLLVDAHVDWRTRYGVVARPTPPPVRSRYGARTRVIGRRYRAAYHVAAWAEGRTGRAAARLTFINAPLDLRVDGRP